MSKAFTPKIVTANALLDGDVVYLTHSGWSRDLKDAEILTDPAHAELRVIEASKQTDTVVGVYMAEIKIDAGVPSPSHFRETFRSIGPSNYHHGKQEAG